MKISFTKRAEKNYSLIKEYIRTEWGYRLEEAFEQKTKDFLDLLKDFHQMGYVEVKDKQIRGILLTKHTKIFYRIKSDIIIVLTFFDVRQDPGKNTFRYFISSQTRHTSGESVCKEQRIMSSAFWKCIFKIFQIQI